MDNKKVAADLVRLAKELSGAGGWEGNLKSLGSLEKRLEELVKNGKRGAQLMIDKAAGTIDSQIKQLRYERQHVMDYTHSEVSPNVRHMDLEIPENVKKDAKRLDVKWDNAIRELEGIKRNIEKFSSSLR